MGFYSTKPGTILPQRKMCLKTSEISLLLRSREISDKKKSRGSNEGETIQQCQTHSVFEKKLPASACIDFVCLNPEPRNLTQAMKASMPNNTVTFLTWRKWGHFAERQQYQASQAPQLWSNKKEISTHYQHTLPHFPSSKHIHRSRGLTKQSSCTLNMVTF